ncbi:MAG: GGDEF domain-containing protein [Parvibaculum sp.]|nr:GGDEF domain-containing protein [Parvibaculum sp.]
MSTFTDDLTVANEWSMKALALMTHNKIVPVPANYEVWFRYASGQAVDLTEEIDRRLREGKPVDAEVTSELHQRYVSQTALADAAMETGDKLGTEIDKILKLVQSAAGDNSALGSSVRAASEGLTNKSSPTDVRRVVEAIMSASVEMESRSKALELRLTETKSELSALQTNLSKARNEARTDGLTGVNNRKAFDELLAQEIAHAGAEGTQLCLIMGDIDHFKAFNDTWGHRTGDQVLRLVASCLKGGAREVDHVARYGGEEFAVIMPGISTERAEKLANSIREAVQARELVKRSTGETLGRVTMSLGISHFRAGDNAGSLIERADGCLYTAKRSGRNRVISEDSKVAPVAKAS